MSPFTIAAIQMRSGIDPAANARAAAALVNEAADRGARYVQTPEVTNLVQRSRRAAESVIATEADDATLAALRDVAARRAITVHIGSLALRDGDAWVNRAFVIGPDGEISAKYDKIHMFDVDLPSGERYRESGTYTAGESAVVADVNGVPFGITICFDIRFGGLYASLADAGALALTAPSAFAVATGEAHWHVLMRARAIENAAYMIAAAQQGKHEDGRTTYGHALIVDPWGNIVAEANNTPAVITAELDLDLVARVRSQVPVLSARRSFAPPQPVREPMMDAL